MLLLFATSSTNRNTLIAIFAERFFRTKSDTLYQFRSPPPKENGVVRSKPLPPRFTDQPSAECPPAMDVRGFLCFLAFYFPMVFCFCSSQLHLKRMKNSHEMKNCFLLPFSTNFSNPPTLHDCPTAAGRDLMQKSPRFLTLPEQPSSLERLPFSRR